MQCGLCSEYSSTRDKVIKNVCFSLSLQYIRQRTWPRKTFSVSSLLLLTVKVDPMRYLYEKQKSTCSVYLSYCIINTELPDPFAKIVVDGSGQCHCTDVIKSTLDPKWNQHYDL